MHLTAPIGMPNSKVNQNGKVHVIEIKKVKSRQTTFGISRVFREVESC